MGRVGGEQLLGLPRPALRRRPAHHRGARRPRRGRAALARRSACGPTPTGRAIGVDLTFRARTQPYGLRRGTMRAGDDVVWDQSHILQSGTYTGTYTVGGTAHEVDGWVGQRDHSWGIRDHGRCPLWMWFQIQLDDGFLGVWHWELANGARVYTDGCWAGADGSDPVPVVGFDHDVDWLGADGAPAAYGEHGEAVAGLARHAAASRSPTAGASTVEAEGRFARPYEPFHRGGLNLMRVRTDDGRAGTAIYEVTGARHHRFFPDTDRRRAVLPS